MPYFQFQKRLLVIAFFLFLVSTVSAATSPPLVSTDWLKQHLTDPHVAIIDMSDSLQYQRFHIPGARHLPYNVLNQQNRQRVS